MVNSPREKVMKLKHGSLEECPFQASASVPASGLVGIGSQEHSQTASPSKMSSMQEELVLGGC